MRVLGGSVLALEAIVVLLATALATSNGSVSRTALAWAVGLVLMALLVLTAGALGRPWGVWAGWVMQVLVMATSLVVGWAMLLVGGIFVLLWFLAVRNGTRVDALRAERAAEAQMTTAEGPTAEGEGPAQAR